jgi:malate synthase
MATETAGVEIRHPSAGPPARWEEVLTPEAIDFLALLHRTFNGERLRLLELRKQRQAELDAGASFDFLPETADVRSGDWKVVEPASGLSNRRVEITGPTNAKMLINALNSGAPASCRLRGLELALLVQHGGRSGQPRRRGPPPPRIRLARRQGVRLDDRSGDASSCGPGWHLPERT